MLGLGRCFRSKHMGYESLEQNVERVSKEIPSQNKVISPQNKFEFETQKILSFLNSIDKKDAESAFSKNAGSYIKALGDSTFHSGEAGYVLSTAILVGANTAEGLKGVGLGLYAGVDLSNSLIKGKRISRRKENELKISDSLKHSSSHPFRLFKFNKDKVDFIMLGLSDKSHFYDKQKLNSAYKKILDNLINEGDFYKQQKLIKTFNTLLTIKECINNMNIRDIGLKYGFLNVKDKCEPFDNPLEFLMDKLPESITKIREDINKLKNSEYPLKQSNVRMIKDMERTVYKLQLIQIYDSLKKINKIRNSIDGHYAIVDIAQALGASLGFSGMVTLLAQPLSAPVSAPILASGIALRTAAVLYAFIRKRVDNHEIGEIFERANKIDKKLVATSRALMSELSDPIICEKFPKTVKCLFESMNEVSPSDNFINSVEQNIIEKFENKIKNGIKQDPELRKEWEKVGPGWQEIKIKNVIIPSELEIREFCNSSIEYTAKFIMKSIHSLKAPQDRKNVDKIVDTLIEARVLSEIIKFAGINENDTGINSGEFIEKVVQAKEEADAKRYCIGTETVSSSNMNQRLFNFNKKMNDLKEKGISEINSVVALSHEFETLMLEKITKAQQEAEQNNGSKKLIVLEDKLINAMKKLI